MATFERSEAGKYLWKKHRRRVFPWLIPVFFYAVGLPIFMFAYALPVRLNLFTVSVYLIFLVAILLTFRGISKIDTRIEDGARGEKLVGKELEKLHKEGFSVFHDYYEVGRGNVDHFIVGPPGVFAIETKAWKGEVSSSGDSLLVGGKPVAFKNPVRQVKGEAKDISRLIKDVCGIDIWVHPIVCFSRAELRTHGSVCGVEVVDAGSVNRSIMTHRGWRRHALSRPEIRAITSLLQKHLGTLPAASPEYPPRERGFMRKILASEKFYLGAYGVFLFILTVIFAEDTAAIFENLAEVYRFFGMIRSLWL